MWWYGCSNLPSMFFGPIMMFLFMAACMAMLFFMMRHGLPSGNGPISSFDTRLGPWRNVTSADTTKQRTNTAFEEYREQTLRRLEEEQLAFKSFLDQLRSAKDSAEFEQFMAQRKSA